MAFARISLVLALFCEIASASWGPHGLVADVDNSKGDFADLKVQWIAGDCPYSDFTLYSQAPGGKKVEETYTSNTSFRIVNKEFWTNYTISLNALNCFVEKPLVSYVYTGPGNPHKVARVETASSIFDANVKIHEAFMPKPVDQYNVTWCSHESCQNQIFVRNNHGTSAKFNLMLTGLSPNTSYDLTIIPEISFEGRVYRGQENTTRFSTKGFFKPLPQPTQIRQEFKLTWKLEESPYKIAFFNVNLTNPYYPAVGIVRNVTEPEVIFVDMPVPRSMIALVTTFYNVSGYLIRGEPTSIVLN